LAHFVPVIGHVLALFASFAGFLLRPAGFGGQVACVMGRCAAVFGHQSLATIAAAFLTNDQ